MRIKVELVGCDAETEFIIEEGTAEEIEFLYKVRDKANATSTYGCMPRMNVFALDNLPSEQVKS